MQEEWNKRPQRLGWMKKQSKLLEELLPAVIEGVSATWLSEHKRCVYMKGSRSLSMGKLLCALLLYYRWLVSAFRSSETELRWTQLVWFKGYPRSDTYSEANRAELWSWQQRLMTHHLSTAGIQSLLFSPCLGQLPEAATGRCTPLGYFISFYCH